MESTEPSSKPTPGPEDATPTGEDHGPSSVPAIFDSPEEDIRGPEERLEDEEQARRKG